MKYLVTWEIDSDAQTPKQAALEAYNTMKRPNSIATVFTVINNETKRKTKIDLEKTVLKDKYFIEKMGDMFQSVFPEKQSELSQLHGSFKDAFVYMTDEVGIPAHKIEWEK